MSPVGAGGLWQFMPGTGKQFKLNITSYIDDRRDPIKSTYAAAKYLHSLNAMFDDWLLAIAAYNCGPGNVRKAINRSGGKTNFWEIFPYLPKETRGYVPAFIAAYYVFEYHAEHNLYARDVNFPPVVDTIMVTEKLHLQQVSEVLNIPLQFLLDINPQYKLNIIPINEKGNTLFLPIEYISPFLTFQDSILKYKDSIFFNPNTISKTATLDKSTNSSSSNTSSTGKSKVYYYVKKGDNLGLVSSWFDVNVSEIKSWNHLKKNSLFVGQKLAIYVPSDKHDYYTRVTSMSYSQKQKHAGNSTPSVSSTKSTTSASTPQSSTTKKTTYVYYKVKSGDTLWAISQKYANVSTDDIKRLNGLSSKSRITPGMRLKIKTM
jgi:membrane-bound lytic murein transglycosylase D